MKNILILNLLAGFFFAGCMSENPVNTDPLQTGGKNLEWIRYSDDQMKTEAELTVSKTINGSSGGKIIINEMLGNIVITGTLTVPQGAYQGNQVISITFNDQNSYQVYAPTPYTFKVPLVLDLIYKNINLTGVNPADVGFYYQADDSTYFQALYNSVTVDQLNNTLGISGARIPHFSRWGWAKDAETD